jgi:hypothetical protein
VAYTWVRFDPDALAGDEISDEDAARETEAFLTAADADGRNARTLASVKGRLFGDRLFGGLDWR